MFTEIYKYYHIYLQIYGSDGVKGALEVLNIIYKNPKLTPKEIHAKRNTNLSTSIYRILQHLKELGLVSDETYTITSHGKEELQSREEN